MQLKKLFLFSFIALLLSASLQAQVLGACGGDQNNNATVTTAAKQNTPDGLTVQPIPLPGQQAIDFQLPAVVGNNIQNVKLSDYAGKWRVLCFFPAAFTFV